MRIDCFWAKTSEFVCFSLLRCQEALPFLPGRVLAFLESQSRSESLAQRKTSLNVVFILQLAGRALGEGLAEREVLVRVQPVVQVELGQVRVFRVRVRFQLISCELGSSCVSESVQLLFSSKSVLGERPWNFQLDLLQQLLFVHELPVGFAPVRGNIYFARVRAQILQIVRVWGRHVVELH